MKQTKQTKKRGGNKATKQKNKTIKSDRIKTTRQHNGKRKRNNASEYFKYRMSSNNIPLLSALRIFTLNKYTDEDLENITDAEIRNLYDEFKLESSTRVKHNRGIRRSKKLNPDFKSLSKPKTIKKSKSPKSPKYYFSPGRRSDEEEIQILERFNNESKYNSPNSPNINFDDDLFDDEIK
tara:strand:- start:2507 stop:3046 length:540 start_codon:yes stop_codon:yes gene_type:complete